MSVQVWDSPGALDGSIREMAVRTMGKDRRQILLSILRKAEAERDKVDARVAKTEADLAELEEWRTRIARLEAVVSAPIRTPLDVITAANLTRLADQVGPLGQVAHQP